MILWPLDEIQRQSDGLVGENAGRELRFLRVC
jgi:hypothetical protein